MQYLEVVAVQDHLLVQPAPQDKEHDLIGSTKLRTVVRVVDVRDHLLVPAPQEENTPLIGSIRLRTVVR